MEEETVQQQARKRGEESWRKREKVRKEKRGDRALKRVKDVLW